MKAKPASQDGQFVVRMSEDRYAVVQVSRIVADDSTASAESRTLLADLRERFRHAGSHTLAAIPFGAGTEVEVKGLMANNIGTSTDQ